MLKYAYQDHTAGRPGRSAIDGRMTTETAQSPRPSKVLGGIILLSSLTVGWFSIDFYLFKQTSLNIGPRPVNYAVAPGTPMKTIADDLYRRGIIDHPRYLVWLARWQGQADKIKAGEYALEPGITPQEMLEKLVSGKVVQHSLTIVEGWTFRQMLEAVDRDPDITHTLTGMSDSRIMDELGLTETSPEGLFYPDTYHFPENTSDVTFLQRAYKNMQDRLDEAWRHLGLPYKTPYEALIAASIIEKETAVPAERMRIAGVLVRRLEKGMRLAVDPSVIYGMGEGFDGNLRRSDLRRDTPYNTYLHKGLPPTPIALPGEDSLEAALHPDAGDTLYYVSRGDGTHQFSATLEEHRRAVAKYQLGNDSKAMQ